MASGSKRLILPSLLRRQKIFIKESLIKNSSITVSEDIILKDVIFSMKDNSGKGLFAGKENYNTKKELTTIYFLLSLMEFSPMPKKMEKGFIFMGPKVIIIEVNGLTI